MIYRIIVSSQCVWEGGGVQAVKPPAHPHSHYYWDVTNYKINRENLFKFIIA
jgi:hypothetical protein